MRTRRHISHGPMRLLESYILSVLSEEGRGTALSQERKQLQKTYEAAAELLALYRQEAEQTLKQRATDKNVPIPSPLPQGITEDSTVIEFWSKLTVNQRNQKAYKSFAPTELQRRSPNVIQDEFDKAQKNYAKVNPRLTIGPDSLRRMGSYAPPEVQLSYKSSGGARTTADMETPQPGSNSFMDIDKVTPKKWYPWPADFLKHVKENNIPYGSSSEESENDSAEAGVGPAEAWLEALFGGKKQGGGVSYDLVTQGASGYQVWEVKELKTKSETIRPGTHGLKVFARPYSDLKKVIAQMSNFYVVAKNMQLLDAENTTLTPEQKRVIGFTREFVEVEKSMIVEKGEISDDRVRSIFAVLEELKALLNELSTKTSAQPGDPVRTDVALNDEEFSVDKETFIDIAKKVKKNTGKKPPVADLEILMSTLRHPAFVDPVKFLDEFFTSVDPQKVFEGTDGVFIVNKEKFMLIPIGDLPTAVSFTKVTQGKPRFKLVLPWS